MNKIALFILVLAVCGCDGNRDMQPLNLDPPQKKVAVEELDFAAVFETVFKPSCISCHSEAAGNTGGVNLETYENVFRHVPQIKMEVTGGMMPPGKPLTSDQAQLLANWIDAGAKEKTGDPVLPEPVDPVPVSTPPPPPVPAPDVVTFSIVREKILQTSCVGCHSEASGNMGDVNLETYESVFEKRAVLLDVVSEGRMPPKKKTPLTDEQKRLFLLWLNQGAKP